MPIVLLGVGIILILALSSKKASASGGGGAAAPTVDPSLAACGPYPPFVTTPDGKLWRPYCPALEPGVARQVAAVPGEKVRLFTQEGARGPVDQTNTVYVGATVVSGDPISGYNFRVEVIFQSFNMQPGVSPPPIGTVFPNVLPSFIEYVVEMPGAAPVTPPPKPPTDTKIGGITTEVLPTPTSTIDPSTGLPWGADPKAMPAYKARMEKRQARITELQSSGTYTAQEIQEILMKEGLGTAPNYGGTGGGAGGGVGGYGYTRPRSYGQVRAMGGATNVIPISYGRRAS